MRIFDEAKAVLADIAESNTAATRLSLRMRSIAFFSLARVADDRRVGHDEGMIAEDIAARPALSSHRYARMPVGGLALSRRPEAHYAILLFFHHRPVAQQQIDVPEHL